ncbi:MAG: RebB family R body protein [Ramlibacter sp.]|nr:RebB family R body protein [Ramlibacter sp.]
MSDDAKPDPGPADASAVNDQITDSVTQVQATLAGMQAPFAAAAAYQTIAHALGLALHNAVARQQHSHMLRNALTTAAATALLDGRTEQAEAVLKLAESPLVNPSLGTELGQLQSAVAQLREEIDKVLKTATS